MSTDHSWSFGSYLSTQTRLTRAQSTDGIWFAIGDMIDQKIIGRDEAHQILQI